MALTGFSIALVGDNFPVQSIKTSDFLYRHRSLNETLRLPVAVQAENGLVAMQILQDRFDVFVKTPDDVDKQVAGITEMVNVFLEYVGKRTISAVGHNAQWALPGGSATKALIAKKFVDTEAISSLIESEPRDIDFSFAFTIGSETRSRASLRANPDGDPFFEFNSHFDMSSPEDIGTAIAELSRTLTGVRKIGEALDREINGVRA